MRQGRRRRDLRVGERAATLSPLDVPAGIRYCGLNVKEFIWGATSDWRPYWTTNGRFDQRRLDCSEGLDFTGMSPDEFQPGLLQPRPGQPDGVGGSRWRSLHVR